MSRSNLILFYCLPMNCTVNLYISKTHLVIFIAYIDMTKTNEFHFQIGGREMLIAGQVWHYSIR